jgi:hypothetical protein
MINRQTMAQKNDSIKNLEHAEEQPDEQQEEEEMGLLEQFKQQMMKAWQPVPTLTKTIIIFFILSAFFLSIGIVMIILSKNLNESSIRYDTVCPINSTCSLTFEVTDVLQAPVFVYYEIHNFYQNHRLYASSYSYDQLTGATLS